MNKMRSLVAGATIFMALASGAASAETVKIAYIDTLSGLMGSLGNNELKSWQYVTEVANQQDWAGGQKFEMVPFDNKLSPQQSLTLLN